MSIYPTNCAAGDIIEIDGEGLYTCVGDPYQVVGQCECPPAETSITGAEAVVLVAAIVMVGLLGLRWLS